VSTWHYSEEASPHYQGQVYDEKSGKTLAITYNDEGGSVARLISAAPELLDTLIKLRSAWVRTDEGRHVAMALAMKEANAILCRVDECHADIGGALLARAMGE
jgi:hypothetical protein